MSEEVKVIEVDTKKFEEELKAKEAKIQEAETKFLKRLVQEAKDAKVDVEEKELLEIGEKGIIKLIELAKKLTVKEEETPAVEPEKKEETPEETKGEVSGGTEEFSPSYRNGAIKVQGHEMFAEWNYASFKEELGRALTGKPAEEDVI